MFTISAIGYGPEKLFGYNLYTKPYTRLARRIHQIITTELSIQKSIHCFCNGSSGTNQLFGLIIKKLKESNSNVSMEFVLPCLFHSVSYVNDPIYNLIYECSDKITTISNSLCTSYSNLNRDIYMIKNSSLIISIYDRYSNYDEYIEELLEYAKNNHIPVVNPYVIPRDKYE